MRKIRMCTIDGAVGKCAVGDKKSELKFPEEMKGFTCWDFYAQYLLGEKLQDCEQSGRLPKDDNTWEDMKVCEIYIDNFVKVPCKNPDLVASVCTDPEGVQKIVSKLQWCRQR